MTAITLQFCLTWFVSFLLPCRDVLCSIKIATPIAAVPELSLILFVDQTTSFISVHVTPAVWRTSQVILAFSYSLVYCLRVRRNYRCTHKAKFDPRKRFDLSVETSKSQNLRLFHQKLLQSYISFIHSINICLSTIFIESFMESKDLFIGVLY